MPSDWHDLLHHECTGGKCLRVATRMIRGFLWPKIQLVEFLVLVPFLSEFLRSRVVCAGEATIVIFVCFDPFLGTFSERLP